LNKSQSYPHRLEAAFATGSEVLSGPAHWRPMVICC